MKEITSKYPGMDASCSSIGMLKEKCREYDNTKDKTIFKEATKLIYWGFFTEMVNRQGADNLNIKEDGIYVDCTLGYAGHSSQILKV